jgi:hypothetical protein
MSSNAPRILFGTIAAVVVTLGNPAYAGTWSATYDPAALVGVGTFDVPAPCLSVSDGQYAVGAVAGCSTITVLTNVATTPAINFNPILPSTDVTSYDVIGGAFVGVNTGVIGSVFTGGNNYWFQFLASYSPDDGQPFVTNTVNLYNDCPFEDPTMSNCGTPVATANTVTFTQTQTTPEPGSLGLILGAVGAGWLARRRKA